MVVVEMMRSWLELGLTSLKVAAVMTLSMAVKAMMLSAIRT